MSLLQAGGQRRRVVQRPLAGDGTPMVTLPGGMLLLSKAHVDTLSEMPPERQREFGPIAAWIEHAIMNLGRVARVHLYRWGDGRAHFHVHFVPRPLDFRSLVGGIYPFSRRASPTLVKNIW